MEKQVSEHIWRGPDGVYRWTYEVEMLKNPTILITVWKVLGISFGAVYGFVVLVSLLTDSMYGWEGFWDLTRGFLILAGVFLVISVIAYLIVAGMYGWKYVVHFELSETGVVHITDGMQAKKAETLGQLTMLAGALAKNRGAVSAGRLSAGRTTSTSEFSKVRTVKVRPRRHVIHVNMLLDRNQVYAAEEDFGFVRDYIVTRCVNAKVR